jgi:hypothetical protein
MVLEASMPNTELNPQRQATQAQDNFDWLSGCYNKLKRRHDAMKRVLRDIAKERPNYDQASSAFYRVRQKAKSCLEVGLSPK